MTIDFKLQVNKSVNLASAKCIKEYVQLITIYLAKSKAKQTWRGPGKFDIWFFVVLTVLPENSFSRGDWAKPFSPFSFEICVLLQLIFDNSLSKLYSKFVTTDAKFWFSCGESNLHGKTVNWQYILSPIVVATASYKCNMRNISRASHTLRLISRADKQQR